MEVFYQYLGTLKEIFIEGERYKYILEGLKFSVTTSVLAAIIGVTLGIILALMTISHFYPFGKSKFNPFARLAFLYIDIIRGTPAVIQLMFLYSIVFVGKLNNVPMIIIAAIAFGLNSGAYVAEIIRAGIEGLDKGQMEAARALGLTYSQAMKEIIIPQAIVKILPTLVSEFIVLLKETSVVGFIGGVDLLRSASIITSQTYRGVEPLLAVGIIYLILTSVFTRIMRSVEKGLKVND